MTPETRKENKGNGQTFLKIVFFLLLILGGGAFLTAWVARRTDREMREDLGGDAVRAAAALNFHRVTELDGTETDLNSPVYRRLKGYLSLLREAYPDCRFAYLLGQKGDGTVYFLADSESETAPDRSPPGQIYHEASEEMRQVFKTGNAVVEGPLPDRWGQWVSALAPVIEPRTGQVLAILGLDIAAADWEKRVVLKSLPPAILSLVLVAILLAGAAVLKRRRRWGNAAPRWMTRMEPALAAAGALALTVFSAWTAHRIQVRNRTLLFRQLADQETNLVAEFFRDLRDFELEALARFFEASEYVSQEEFEHFARVMLAEPAVLSWEWIPVVPADEAAKFKQDSQAADRPQPGIWEPGPNNARQAAGPRKTYYPVLYAEPAERAGGKLGEDQGWNPLRRRVLETAARTGLATATIPLSPDSPNGRGWSITIYHPIFKGKKSRELRGFVAAQVSLESLLLSAREKVLAHLTLCHLEPEAPRTTLATTCAGKVLPPREMETNRPVAAFGKMFWLSAHPGPEFMASFASDAGFWAALAGLLVSAGLTILIWAPLRIKEELGRKVAERTAELAKSNARFERLAEESQTVSWGVDADGLFTYVSPVAEDVFGYRPEELVGRRHFYDLHPPEGREKFKADSFETFQRKGSFRNLENRIQTRSGEIIWVSTNGVPFFSDDGTFLGYNGNDTDITERKIAEGERERLLVEAEASRKELWRLLEEEKKGAAERTRLTEQLQQAQKMEAVGRLAGGVAHDFNNILQVILWTLDQAASHPGLSDSLSEELEEIRTEAERAAALTGQLLAFARKQPIAPQILDLNETVEQMLKMLRRLIGEDIELSWQPGQGLWPIKADPVQINQVLANLCINARDAISGPGEINIRTFNSILAEADCEKHPDSRPGEYVRLSVADTGCGMDEPTRERIFEPFFSTKAVGAGTGLGLATVYGIVKQNRGHIEVSSRPGAGTSFDLYFPRTAAKSQEGESENEQLRGGEETILLVEDEEAIGSAIRSFLEGIGYNVIAATHPEQALLQAESFPGKIHLLLTDVVMPGMNGRELADRMKSSYPAIKCIFMSGYPTSAILRQGVLEEGAHLIQKPFSRQKAAEKIREVLDDG